MYIANNILKYNLTNVYFLGGTACGGKTTMGKALAKKYGFVHFDDNHQAESFKRFCEISAPEYQPNSARMNAVRAKSWSEYFERLASGDDMLEKSSLEGLQFILMELIRLSKDRGVIADLYLPVNIAKEITEYQRVAFLVTSPENVVKDYCCRDDHRDIYDLIMTLDDPQKSLDDLSIYLKNGTQKFLNEVIRSGLYYIERNEESTVEKTMWLLEKHFGLIRN